MLAFKDYWNCYFSISYFYFLLFYFIACYYYSFYTYKVLNNFLSLCTGAVNSVIIPLHAPGKTMVLKTKHERIDYQSWHGMMSWGALHRCTRTSASLSMTARTAGRLKGKLVLGYIIFLIKDVSFIYDLVLAVILKIQSKTTMQILQ